MSATLREAILAGQALELIPDDAKGGWYLRVGIESEVIRGRTAAECFLYAVELMLWARVDEPGEQ